MGILCRIVAEDIPCIGNKTGAVPDEMVAAPAVRILCRAGQGKHVPPLIQRPGRGNECTASLGHLRNHRGQTQAADDPVSYREMPPIMGRSRRILREDGTPGADVLIETPVFFRIYDIVTAADDSCRQTAGTQCATMGRGVAALGKAGHHHRTKIRQLDAAPASEAGEALRVPTMAMATSSSNRGSLPRT